MHAYLGRNNINPTLCEYIATEINHADERLAQGDYRVAFQYLERAHVLGQAITYEHARVHWRMLKLAIKLRSPQEIFGQILRIAGASTKTPFGISPSGNTGGSNDWFYKPMQIPEDLKKILAESKQNEN